MKTLLQDRSRPAGGYRDAGAAGGGSRRERRCRGDLAVTESDKHLQSEAKGKKFGKLISVWSSNLFDRRSVNVADTGRR